MSPTILREEGFTFFFYANEHESKHNHVMKGDDFMKVNLENLGVIQCFMKKRDAARATVIIEKNRELLIRGWNEYFKR